MPIATPERWEPDEQLIPALLAHGGRTLAALSPADRSWAVAGLTLLGLTADDIAARLDCCRRRVHAIKAEPMTAVCVLVMSMRETYADELRLLRSELTQMTRRHAKIVIERDRTQAQFDRLLDAHLAGQVDGTFSCGHPRTPYNTYTHSQTGRSFCRECRRETQASYRERRRSNGSQLAQLPV